MNLEKINMKWKQPLVELFLIIIYKAVFIIFFCVFHIAYDGYGNQTLTTDAKGNQTQILYNTVGGYRGLYTTQTVIAHGTSTARISTENYDFYTGLVTSATDVDNNGTSTTAYDDLGRTTKVAATVVALFEIWTQTGYDDADQTMVTDQAGKRRISKMNALGQLTDVWEITAADLATEAISFGVLNLNDYKTSYTYDILNNLTTVNQGSQQPRTFIYTSLSRLKSATNLESRLAEYQYDDNGNLTSKTDGRSITTSYFYDALNRVTQRSHSGEIEYATPTVFYFYDNLPNAKGKLIKVSNSVSTTEYSNFDILGRELNNPKNLIASYRVTNKVAMPIHLFLKSKFTSFDILGRVLMHKQMTDGQTYSTSYGYNLSGTLTEQTYPFGRVVKNAFDADGNLAEVESKKNSSDVFRNYATNFAYTAAGATSSLKLGNGRFENTLYNSRLQPVQIGLGSSATNQNLLELNFDYGATDNNGNVKSQTITVPITENVLGFTAQQTYSYDSLNRIKQAAETINNNQTPNWKQTFAYDRFGNRRFDEANTTTLAQNCPTGVSNPTIDSATNKLIGYQFDNAGNTKTDAENRTFTYDGENKQVKVKDQYGTSIGRYFYDGDGRRVKKNSLTETTLFIYNACGQLVAEYSTQLSQQPNISYMTADHLDNPRIAMPSDRSSPDMTISLLVKKSPEVIIVRTKLERNLRVTKETRRLISIMLRQECFKMVSADSSRLILRFHLADNYFRNVGIVMFML